MRVPVVDENDVGDWGMASILVGVGLQALTSHLGWFYF